MYIPNALVHKTTILLIIQYNFKVVLHLSL